MKTVHLKWTITELTTKIDQIDFPEFQREPTVWTLEKKELLIDSILRDFDISPIYLHQNKSGVYDCIDGRQRLNAIFSYLGINAADKDHNAFILRITNEIYDDKGRFDGANEKKYERLSSDWKKQVNEYALNIVLITDIKRSEELNLLFMRLQIASVLNAGEKLHAMIGDMRNWVFKISKHAYFQDISIPRRRYAKEQVVAQIALNVFGLKKEQLHQSSRFVDLQDFFKLYSNLSSEDMTITKGIEKNLDTISKHFKGKLDQIHNRALAVSVYLFAAKLIENNHEKMVTEFANFLEKFLQRLSWQVKKGILKMHPAYHDLLKFQTNVTQAAGESYAIRNRHDFLQKYFDHYRKSKFIKGDEEYKQKTKKDPGQD